MRYESPKLKILYVLSSFTLGGTETHLLRLIDGLKSRGYEIHVCLLYNRHDILHELQDRGIEYHFLGMKGIFDVRGVYRLWRLLNKHKFDIVHAYLFDPSIYTPLVAKLAGVNAIFTSRRNYDDWMGLCHLILQRIANQFTDMILVNSESVKHLVERQEKTRPEKVTTIYNSIEKDKFSRTGNKNIIKEHFGLKPDDMVITCVAKFKVSKGHSLLLKAAEKVIEKMPNAKFLLVGKGPLMESIIKETQNEELGKNILFLGERADIADILSISDVCVLSSIREGFANVILEYMASGQAIVATDVGGAREVITNRENGILVPKEDVAVLSHEITGLLKDEKRREELGARARERVEDIAFEPDYEADRFDATYRESLNIKTAKVGLIFKLRRKLNAIKSFAKDITVKSKKNQSRTNVFCSQTDAAIHTKKEPQTPGAKRLNVILISIDPLRMDHMGLYGYRRNTTPNIDNFAKMCAVFTKSYSQAPWTTPSHMSVFTSLYPSFHGVDQPIGDTMRKLSKEKKTLAEYLKQHDYMTGAFTGSGSISARWGFDKGFDIYDETPSEEVKPKGHDIGIIYDKAVDWIKKNRTRDFFLFFHSYNTHTPYNDRYFVTREKISRFRKNEYRKALYDGDIRIADIFFGNFIVMLKNENILKDTVIILISDHGEDFGEHYPFEMTKGHGHSLYEELLHIPLIIYHPHLTENGTRIDKCVRLIDVMPTVLNILDISLPQDIQGQSLLPLLRGEDVELPKYFFAEAVCYGPDRKMISDGRYKYIYAPLPNVQKTTRKIYPVKMHELYCIQKDPGEKENIYYKEKEIARSMHEGLLEFMKGAEENGYSTKAKKFKIDEKLKERLRSLGYIE